jgi:hypothetical protein
MLVIVNILIIGFIRIIGFKCNYCNGVVDNFMYISTNVKANIILSLMLGHSVTLSTMVCSEFTATRFLRSRFIAVTAWITS